MHLTLRSGKKLLFGKFGHGMMYGNMNINKDGSLTLDIYDSDTDDGDPAVTFDTETRKFTFFDGKARFTASLSQEHP